MIGSDALAQILASVAGATGMTIAVRLLTPELHISMIVFLRAGICVGQGAGGRVVSLGLLTWGEGGGPRA